MPRPPLPTSADCSGPAVPPLGRPRLYTIAPGDSFADALAGGLLARAAGDPLELAGSLILVPTRRAARGLAQAFLRQSGGRALLLPRFRPLGDADDEELALTGMPEALDLAPAMPPLERRFLLARLVLGWWQARGEAAHLGAALAHAGELARLIDEIATEGADWQALETLVPAALAGHWQETLSFLQIAGRHWPAVRDAGGTTDPAVRRDALLRLQARQWQERPPAHPVLVAGSTGSIPATAELIAVVARLPQGAVILPGLDLAMADDGWAGLGPGHPQWAMRGLLEAIRASRDDVEPWPPGRPRRGPSPRQALLAEAMRPAETTDLWHRTRAALDLPAAFRGLSRIDAPDRPAEARAIALLLRGALETPARTAMLVTPDRALALRVSAELARWGIQVDDSAGVPLGTTVPGGFLRLVLAAAVEDLAPLALLALLKHPLAALGMARGDSLGRTRRLERLVLRGPRPQAGLAGLRQALAARARAADAAGRPRDLAPLHDLVDRLARALAPLFAALAAPRVAFAALVEAHVAAAEALAATAEATGAAALWRGEAGEVAAGLIADLIAAGTALGAVAPADYPGLFDEVLQAVTVRPRFGSHPRLAILGPLEARLASADLVVLGSLNEGTWPAEPAADPWLSRAMRQALGLAPLERRLGQAAHDFATLAAAPCVVVTRAAKIDLAPTVPSRWLRRLDALAGADGWPLDPALARAAGLDPPVGTPTAEPAPVPPPAARPRLFSVTDVEALIRDPYGLYAKRILRLAPLDPIDQAPGAAERGTIIHHVLDRFLSTCRDGDLPDDALARLEALGREAFGALLDAPTVAAFWWPRFLQVAQWFVAVERQRRSHCRPLALETKGTLVVPAPRGPVTVTARADRIDRRTDGTLVVIDYKTGQPPRAADMIAGYRPQLPLEAAMLAAGGFPDIGPGTVGGIEVWRLTGGAVAGEIKDFPRLDLASLIPATLDKVAALFARYDQAEQPYLASPNPAQAGYGDYDHLARRGEWGEGP